MPRKKRLLRGCLVTLLVLACVIIAAIVALAPGEGPPLLAALAPDADIVLCTRDAGALWETLERSARFARFREGPAWRALADSEAGLAFARALESLRKSGLEVTRSRASHLVGREAGAAAWLSPDGRAARSWTAAFRIDTTARIAELAARLSLGRGVKTSDEGGERLHAISGRGGAVHWCRMGDLLVVAGDAASLRRAVANCVLARDPSRARDGAAAWSADPAERFDVAAPPPGRGFHLAVKTRPAPLLAAAGPAAKEIEEVLRPVGVAPPFEALTVSLRLEGGTLIEEDFLRATVLPGRAAAGGPGPSGPGAGRPAGTYLFMDLRPDRDAAAELLRRRLADVLPSRGASREAALAEMDAFVSVLLPRVWGGVTFATAEQAVDVANGGFPADFAFFRVSGAGALRGALETALRARSLGVFEPGDPLPTTYPYLVKRPARGASVYEIVIFYTRRHEGYRPSVAIRGDEIVFSSSLAALERFIDGGGTGEGGAAPPAAAPALDEWLSPGGDEVLRLEWRTPADLRQLRNSYDYLIELDRYKERRATRLVSDATDYAEVWRAIESVLGEIRAHERAAVAEPGGIRVRARWDFSD